MNWIKIFRLVVLVILSILGMDSPSYAQDFTVFPREDYFGTTQEERAFSGVRWMEIKEDIDYTQSVRGERIEDENFFTDGSGQQKNQRIYENQQPGSAIWAMLLKFLIIAVGLLIVAVVIARFLGPEGLGKPRSRRIDNASLEITLNDIEENIHESDLDQFIAQAIDQKNYNLAIRLYYLAIIKELSLSKAIRWKREKTNRTYIQELTGKDYLPELKVLTTIFERSWYGNRSLEERDFLAIQPRYEAMIKKTKALAIKEQTTASNE